MYSSRGIFQKNLSKEIRTRYLSPYLRQCVRSRYGPYESIMCALG